MSLLDLLLEMRGDVDGGVSERALQIQQADAFVEEHRSGLVSAMIKAVRMRKMNHALYFAAILLIGNQAKWYIGRRICIMSCEDGIDDVLMKYVADMHTKKDKEKTMKDLLNGIVAICLRPNWWQSDYGKQMMYGCFREKKVDLEKFTTEEELVALMEKSIFERDDPDGWTISSVVRHKLGKDFGWTLSKVHEWLIEKGLEHATEPWQVS